LVHQPERFPFLPIPAFDGVELAAVTDKERLLITTAETKFVMRPPAAGDDRRDLKLRNFYYSRIKDGQRFLTGRPILTLY